MKKETTSKETEVRKYENCIILVDVGYDKKTDSAYTIIDIVDLSIGVYEFSKIINFGEPLSTVLTSKEVMDKLINIISNVEPTQIIFNTSIVGTNFKDKFLKACSFSIDKEETDSLDYDNNNRVSVEVDEYGVFTYEYTTNILQ